MRLIPVNGWTVRRGHGALIPEQALLRAFKRPDKGTYSRPVVLLGWDECGRARNVGMSQSSEVSPWNADEVSQASPKPKVAQHSRTGIAFAITIPCEECGIGDIPKGRHLHEVPCGQQQG
jgi:hypothetical protein